MKLPYLMEEMMRPDWTDVVWAIMKLGFYGLIVVALIKYLL